MAEGDDDKGQKRSANPPLGRLRVVPAGHAGFGIGGCTVEEGRGLYTSHRPKI